MKKSNPYIIPYYIPAEGCPGRCLYCNSFVTTGTGKEPQPVTKEYFDSRIESFLNTKKGRGSHVEVAFYGGSFNFLSDQRRDFLLGLVRPYLKDGRVDFLRVSLRPDRIDDRILEVLKEHRTRLVEMGVQSMNDDILAAIGRGHGAREVVDAVKRLKAQGIMVSAHLMVGLPNESEERFFSSLERLLELKIDFLRIHPTVVLKDTGLWKLYNEGKYIPICLDEAVRITAKAYRMAKKRGTGVLRMGIQANEAILGPSLVSGPFHESFGELVLSRVAFDRVVERFTKKGSISNFNMRIRGHPDFISRFKGAKGSNIARLKETYGIERLDLVADPEMGKEEFELH